MKRETLLAAAIGATLTDQPRPDNIGGDQGTYKRPPCGTCMHWKKLPEMGLGIGMCMHSPPYALPTQGPGGQMAQMQTRLMPPADSEGCDQHKAGLATAS